MTDISEEYCKDLQNVIYILELMKFYSLTIQISYTKPVFF